VNAAVPRLGEEGCKPPRLTRSATEAAVPRVDEPLTDRDQRL